MSRHYHGDGADGLQHVPRYTGLEPVQPDLEVANNGYYTKGDPHAQAPEPVRKVERKQVAGARGFEYGCGAEKEIVPQTQPLYQRNSGRRICGLKRRIFWIILAAAIVVIIVAIGGGVGGAMASRNNSTSPPISSSTPTNIPQITTTASQSSSIISSSSSASTSTQASSITSPTSLPSGVIAVPSFNGFWNGVTDYTATLTYTAAPPGSTSGLTNIDCPKSNDTEYISSTGDRYIKKCFVDVAPSANTDLNHVIVYSLNDCIDACSVWNSQSNSGKKCKSVSYSADLSVSLGPGGPGKNCHLKSVTGPLNKSRFPVAGAILSS